MDRFHDGQHVRLRCRVLGTYLQAADDGAGVTLDERRSSMNAAWTVHIYHTGDSDGDRSYLILHSAAYGRYLAATATPARIGHHGFRVQLRDYDQPEVEAIKWRAVGSGFAEDVVLLLSFTGGYLRANGKHLPWNSAVSVDEGANAMMYWVVEPIPVGEAGMPDTPGPPPMQRPAIDDARPEVVDSWGLLGFMGRSVFRLRDDLALRVAIDLQYQNIAVCVRAGRYGRLTPFIVDLPHSGGILEIVILLAATPDPIYAALHIIFSASISRNCTTTVQLNWNTDIIASDRNDRALSVYTTAGNLRSNSELTVSQATEAIGWSVSINIKWMMVLGPEAWLSRPDSRICTHPGQLSDAFLYEDPMHAALHGIFAASVSRNGTTAVELSAYDAIIPSNRNAGAVTVYSSAQTNSRSRYQFNVSRARGINAFRLGVSISNLGSALTGFDDQVTGAAEWIEQMTGYLDIGAEFQLPVVQQSAQVSRGLSNVMRTTSSVMSFGARACSVIGFGLQLLHPDAQVGQTDLLPCPPVIRISSLEEVGAVVDDWRHSRDLVVAEVTADMGRAEAREIYRRFLDLGAFDLIRDSTVLKSKIQAPEEESWEIV